MRRWLGLALGVAALLPSGSARAVCGTPPRVRVFPELSQPAPLNTHVWLELPRRWRVHGPCAPSTTECPEGEFELELRSAPSGPHPSRISEVDRRESLSGVVATVELIPKAPLEPETRYEVWLVERRRRSAPRVVGLLRTGSHTDARAPTWSGLEPSKPVKPVKQRATSKTRSVVLAGECGDPLVVLAAAPASDADGPAAAVRYAVWVGDERDRIDFSKPPALYARMDPHSVDAASNRGTLAFGNTSPEFSDFERPNHKNGFRLALRAVDWAGHLSEPSEVRLP